MIALKQIAPWGVELAATGARRALSGGRVAGYIGWTGRGNLGDDVMLAAARALLAPTGVEVFSGARREALLARAGLSDQRTFAQVLLGGGTLINDGYVGIVKQALKMALTMKTLGTGVGSAGFGDANEAITAQWRDILQRFERVGVRGPLSAENLADIGVGHVETIGDLALALTPDQRAGSLQTGRFVLSAALPPGHDNHFGAEFVATEIARTARYLCGLGWQAVPLALNRDDIAPTRNILRAAGLGDMAIARPKTAEAFFALCRGAGLVIGVRLHSAVLACCAGVPPLTIAYRRKHHDFAASMGLDDWMLEPTTLRRNGMTERAEALTGADGANLGATLHERALYWRSQLRGYIGDA